MQIFKLTRSGFFRTNTIESNQCGTKEINQFSYEISCFFKPVLDQNGFLIEHSEIDKVIQNTTKLGGSCEEFHLRIGKAVDKKLKNYCNGYLGYKLIVKPYKTIEGRNFKPSAVMTSMRLNKNLLSLV